MSGKRQAKPQVVFVGCPWKTIRKKYENIFNKKTFKRKFPIHFTIIGRDGNQRAEDLYSEIKRQIASSSRAILDVSGGNPNVALEFGYSEGMGVPCYVFVNKHGQFEKEGHTRSSAIISDLSGIRRNQYKNEKSLQKLLTQFANSHPYTERINKIIRKVRVRNNRVTWAIMAIPRAFANTEKFRKIDLLDKVMQDSGCDSDIANKALSVAKKGKIIKISTGQFGYTTLNL